MLFVVDVDVDVVGVVAMVYAKKSRYCCSFCLMLDMAAVFVDYRSWYFLFCFNPCFFIFFYC
jgi:hypothetical protein